MSKSSFGLYLFAALAVSILSFLVTPLKQLVFPQTPLDHSNPAVPMTSVSRSVVKEVLSVETPEGDGAVVRRSIGSQQLRNLTPFLMLDHFKLAKGSGFPDHPHRGQATVTYLLEGSSQHEDSAGHKGTIEAGGVQWMCAGRGIIHAEMPVFAEGQPDPAGLQLWVDLPTEHKMVEPTYQELSPANVPVAYPEGKDGPISIRVISGKSHGVESPVRPLGGCWYFHFIFKGKGATVFQDLPANWTSFAYVLKGSVLVGSDPIPHESFNTLVFSNVAGETGVKLTAAEDHVELMMASGEPLDQEVFQYGPFVMSSNEAIQKTLQDYQLGRNGFEKAHTWQSELSKSRA